MTTISDANIRVFNQTNSVIDVDPTKSHHSISVEGETGDVTIQIVPHGLTAPRDCEDNVLSQNSTAVFVLGSVDKISVSTENSADYLLSLSSF